MRAIRYAYPISPKGDRQLIKISIISLRNLLSQYGLRQITAIAVVTLRQL